MDNNMDNMIGRRLDGRYELLELIGTGGMADIYKARDITEDRIVAVKILKNEFAGSEDFLRRFRNESKAIALLSHPNIVKIYDVGFNEQIQFIVMEYIDGISLAEYIKLQGVLKWKDAVYFTVQILRALQHAHDRGIVHRDIKSQNVMMLPDGTIKVMDFGIARFNRETDKTLSEKAIGSVHYISPEQARGEMTDEKSDIYSVGVMLYEMLTGQKPFDGETPVAIALQHMQTPPKPLREINSSIPEGLEEITLKAMQKEPSMRYQTAGEMINDIEEFKKDPSIVFEYKYFSADGSTKYFDKVSDPNAPEQNAANDTLSESEEEEDNDLYDDDEDDEEVEERRSPLLPILFAVASVFVIMTAWLIFSIVTKNLGTTSGTTDEMTMPNIIGMTLDDVKEKYPDLNLDIDRQYSTDYKENEVMDQKTPAGRTIKKSTIVNIVISNGPQKVEVDDYANLSAQDAQIKLEKKGLKPKLVYINDDEVAKDIVIKTEPAAHSEVSQGTVVKVYVSNGKLVKAVNVPKFIGMTIEDARKEAEDKNLKLKEVSGSSNEYKEGEVIKQSIDANSVVNEDTEIEVTVCDGKAVSIKTEVSLDLPSDVTDTGTFKFEYFKDGVSFKEEERDMAVNAGKTITFEVSGSEPTTYTIKITNVADTSLSGVLAEINVDFKNEDTEPDIANYNKDLFKELKYKEPETTIPEEPSSVPAVAVNGTVSLDLPSSAVNTGTFAFTYTDTDGNVVKDSETKDMSLAAGKTITFDVSGMSNETKDYIIRITNIKDEELSGTLAEIQVDFTSGEAKQILKSYNQGLFNILKASEPATDDSSTDASSTDAPASADEPSSEDISSVDVTE